MNNMNEIGSLQGTVGVAEFAAASRMGERWTMAPRSAAADCVGLDYVRLDHVRLDHVRLDHVRINKVRALRRAIAAGTYRVSAADVAETMIWSMLG